jgi:hypothetical protein
LAASRRTLVAQEIKIDHGIAATTKVLGKDHHDAALEELLMRSPRIRRHHQS